MTPKLPEPDDVSTEVETGKEVAWFFESSVRAIQEEAYRAGMADAVPDGWKLVPVEPTERMLVFGDDAARQCGLNNIVPAGPIYRYMLSAAPEVK